MAVMNLRKKLIATGLILGVISAVLLYSGPDLRPIGDRTFDGRSESELQFINEARQKNSYGFLLLGASFFLQLAGLLVESNKKT